ncbi:MAG TPA: hypothetical protein VMX13_07475 [Sedimentisphaerales bacterium]|nr:hypothetical protein [Sedimentisphaerales bacterium]
MLEFILLYSLILGTLIVAMLLIMLACGWRPDIDQEKKAWKGAAPVIWRLIIPIFCLLGAFALCKIAGMDDKYAISVGFVLFSLLEGAARFWSHKKRSRAIKKLDNELTCNRKDKPKE